MSIRRSALATSPRARSLSFLRSPTLSFVIAPALSIALSVALSIGASGCKSKAQKEAEAAQGDVTRLQKLVADRHVDSIARALPDAASKLTLPLDETGAGAKLVAMMEKSEDLRISKRSFYALVDAEGVITWAEPGWEVKGRLVAAGFPTIKDCLDGKGFTRGSGRFGGDPPDALIFVDAAPIKPSDKIEGCLVAAWEAIDAADNLQSQLLTDIGMAGAAPSSNHNKPKEQRKLAMEASDVWVAIFRGTVVYMVEDAYQPLEDAAKTIDLGTRTNSGPWTGTFEVTNTGWGASAVRIPGLGDGVGIAVFRHKT